MIVPEGSHQLGKKITLSPSPQFLPNTEIQGLLVKYVQLFWDLYQMILVSQDLGDTWYIFVS